MDRRMWVVVFILASLCFVGGTIYLLREKSEPESWASYMYGDLSRQRFDLQHNGKRLQEREEYLSLLRSTVPHLPQEKGERVKEFLQKEMEVHTFQVETHNAFVRRFNELVQHWKFDVEDGVKPPKEKPLALLSEFQVMK